jgi:large subunit ribosomal protein L24e
LQGKSSDYLVDDIDNLCFRQIFRFCRSKCHKLFKHRKNPRKTRWTKAFRKSHAKELTLDPAFEFEKKRDAPPKYSRELWQQTQEAMKKIEEIKAKRQAHFMFERFKNANEIERQRDRNIVKRNISMIRAPHATKEIGRKARVVVKENQESDEEDEEEMTMDTDEEEEMALEVN